MTDEELSRAVALACGWQIEDKRVMPWRNPTTGVWRSPQQFATSLDACFGPGGPVENAKGRGMISRVMARPDGECRATVIEVGDGKYGAAIDSSPARALCLAFLAAIEVSHD